MNTGMSSNGRTHDSGSWYRGSNPCIPAIKAVIILFNDDRFLVLKIQSSPFGGSNALDPIPSLLPGNFSDKQASLSVWP